MDFNIVDGTGTGQRARVNNKKRLETQTVVRTAEEDAALLGDAYLCGSGPVNLTSGNESAVFYFQNDEDKDVIIRNFTLNSTTMNGAPEGVFLLRLYSNPSGLSSATDIAPANINFGSSKELDSISQFGAEGSTVTGGILAGTSYFPQKEFTRTALSWVVPKGSSFAISIQPDSSNTGVNVNVFLDAYLREVE